jgi:hypothetical protein
MLLYCTMGDAYSSLHGFVVTPLVTTPFSLNLCTMRDTNTSLLCILGASLDFAFRFYLFFVRCNRRTVIIIHLLLRLLLDDDAFADNSSSSAERHCYKLEEGCGKISLKPFPIPKTDRKEVMAHF